MPGARHAENAADPGASVSRVAPTRMAILALLIGALILFVGGGSRFAIGLTLKPIEAEFASGRSLVGLAVAVFQLVSAICLFIAGRLADRISLALVLGGGVLIAGLGIGAMGWISEPWQLVVLYGLVFAVGNGIGSVIPVGVLVSRHFPGQTGLANAVALAGIGLGQLVMMALFASLLADIGWRSVFAWAGAAHLLVLPLIFFVLRQRASTAPGAAAASVQPASGLSVTEAMRTRRFWLLLAVYALCGFEDFFVSTHIVAFAQDRGASALFAGHLLAFMGLTALIGVLIAGAMSDRIGPVAATAGCFALRVAIFALVLVDQRALPVALFALLFGATFLVTAPLTVIFVRDAFGTRHLGALTGLITMVHHICGGTRCLDRCNLVRHQRFIRNRALDHARLVGAGWPADTAFASRHPGHGIASLSAMNLTSGCTRGEVPNCANVACRVHNGNPAMIALFFEVTPAEGQDNRYLEIAASLKPELEKSGGVVYLDRFRSLSRPRVMLSHQIWTDEASLARWRANERHNGAQTAGRNAVFADYRLRIGAVIAHLGTQREFIETEPGVAYNDPSRQPERHMAVVRSSGQPFAGSGISGEAFRSVYTDTSYAWVAAVPNRTTGLTAVRLAAADTCVSAAQLCLVSRDYGMFDRREAPQYFPEK